MWSCDVLHKNSLQTFEDIIDELMWALSLGGYITQCTPYIRPSICLSFRHVSAPERSI